VRPVLSCNIITTRSGFDPDLRLLLHAFISCTTTRLFLSIVLRPWREKVDYEDDIWQASYILLGSILQPLLYAISLSLRHVFYSYLSQTLPWDHRRLSCFHGTKSPRLPTTDYSHRFPRLHLDVESRQRVSAMLPLGAPCKTPSEHFCTLLHHAELRLPALAFGQHHLLPCGFVSFHCWIKEALVGSWCVRRGGGRQACRQQR
jgi:hypothetical protein